MLLVNDVFNKYEFITKGDVEVGNTAALLASVASFPTAVRNDRKVVRMLQDPNWHTAAKAKPVTARGCAVTQNSAAPPLRTRNLLTDP